VHQIKEKFGRLRMYGSLVVEAIAQKYGALSAMTCELSGNPGTLHKKGRLVEDPLERASQNLGLSARLNLAMPMALYCTKKLLTHLKAVASDSVESRDQDSVSKLGAWHANIIGLGRTKLVLCCNQATLACVLFSVVGISRKSDLAKQLGSRLRSRVEGLLTRLGIQAEVIAREILALEDVWLEYRQNRQLLGCMEDARCSIESCFQQGEQNLETIEDELARRIYSSNGYQRPERAVQILLG
jgi:hypothetical protein